MMNLKLTHSVQAFSNFGTVKPNQPMIRTISIESIGDV
ncbi:hypothetical protein M595_4813 [Lyngbya aestuarii BL J]|uniref:Uncharacterized protein n=1 Tax=Lyngbya aestuarii BL J TaxID=1348334 RepID=U7QDG1_9CYAN|nr:hypothetical protein M595_4813 [Lyngbya aestuarii BL J]